VCVPSCWHFKKKCVLNSIGNRLTLWFNGLFLYGLHKFSSNIALKQLNYPSDEVVWGEEKSEWDTCQLMKGKLTRRVENSMTILFSNFLTF